MRIKHKISIPNHVVVYYSKKKNFIAFKGLTKTTCLKLKVKILFAKLSHEIQITSIPSSGIPSNEKKKMKATQGTTVALLKQVIAEASFTIHYKMSLIGVGYRAYSVDKFGPGLLMFKLGYSHPIYFNMPDNLSIDCVKFTKLSIYGDSYRDLTQMASCIRASKIPEPYKGKGILLENENITIKEGKKS